MNLSELAEVERRGQAATPGPWRKLADDLLNRCGLVGPKAPQLQPEDADFIAHAREDLPAVCAALREMDKALKNMMAWDENPPNQPDHQCGTPNACCDGNCMAWAQYCEERAEARAARLKEE